MGAFGGICRGMMTLRPALIALAVAAVPLLAFAQTLPQSTQDRQQIQNLQFQANQPGTNATDRAQIERQISQLQYQINTRSPIQPLPTLTPAWNGGPLLNGGRLPQLSTNPSIAPMRPTIYGSCDSDRAVIAYLTQQISLPDTTRQERIYDENRRAELQKDLRAKDC
jgi:hypothetical protein